MPLATFLTAHDAGMLLSSLLASLVFCAAALWVMPLRPARRRVMEIARTGIAGVLLGATIWTVLFLSWKGFFPFVDAPMPMTAIVASLALAVAGATATLAISVHAESGTRNTVLAGSILAATVSCMLFVTMSAIAAPLVLGYDLIEVLLSMIGCTLLCSIGLHGIRNAGTRRQMLLPGVLVAVAIPVLNLASLSAILPFTEWETAAATPGALALQPLTVVFLSEFAAVLALTRVGAQVDRQTATRTRQENERLRQLTDSTFEGLLVHRDGFVLDANTAFCVMAGQSLDMVKGRPVSDFAAALQAGPAPDNLGQHPIETQLIVTGGDPVPVEMLSREINLGDGQVQVTAVRDIRERRAAEQSARDRQQVHDLQRETEEARERQRIAEEASRAKSAFLAMMSHEIRTPMNAVLGLASTLLDDELTKDQTQAVLAIKTSGDNLLRILNDILDFSRLDAGRMAFESTPFSPARLIQEMLSVHNPGAVEKGLTLIAREEPGMPDRMIGDAGRIRQVLHNLVSNAIKFTRTGQVTVTARCIARTAAEATLEWTVADTGIGIAANKLGSLFDAFVQADSSITRRFGGSGLGLAISKQLIDRMGGTITVTSTPGRGSIFQARLTLKLAAEQNPPLAVPPPRDLLTRRIEIIGRPLRLLLAEDNATNRFVFSRLLRGTMVEIAIAENGLEAVRVAEQAAYDLICMDMSMPEMDGLDATRAIRAGDGPNRRVPIIALTANAFAEDMEACRAAGMDDFLAKPVSKDVLFAAILRLLPPIAADAMPPAAEPTPARASPAGRDPAGQDPAGQDPAREDPTGPGPDDPPTAADLMEPGRTDMALAEATPHEANPVGSHREPRRAA
jgi:PAS domain S-box-containing protein